MASADPAQPWLRLIAAPATKDEWLESSDSEPELSGEDFVAKWNEQMQNQFDPAWVEARKRRREGKAARELERLQKNRETKESKAVQDKLFALFIRVKGIRPPIWRRVLVPAKTALDVMHDKVMCPVVGWHRNYHAYVFRQPGRKDKDVGFAPTNSRSVDMMHLDKSPGGEAPVDSSKAYLFDFLQKPGDYLRYVYDMGDKVRHDIHLEEIRDPAPGEPQFMVLGGARACPCEDSGHLSDYVDRIKVLRKKKGDGKYSPLLRFVPFHLSQEDDARVPRRYQLSDKGLSVFDPDHFDVKEAQKAMEAALNSKLSRQDDANMFSHVLRTGLSGRTADVGGSIFDMAGQGKMRECARCGTRGQMKMCSRCKNVAYCGAQCQKDHWKAHKPFCIRPAIAAPS